MGLVHRNGHAKVNNSSNLMLLALVVGLILGAGLAALWVWLTPPSVPTEDYAVLVAAAYSKERLPLNAVERLTSAGVRDPAATLVAIAKTYSRDHPQRDRDAANLDQLAEAIRPQSLTGAGSAPVPPAGDSDSSGWPILIGVVVLAGGAAFLIGRRRGPGRAATLPALRDVSDPERRAELMGGMRSELPISRGGDEDGDFGLEHTGQTSIGASPVGRVATVTGRRREMVLRPFVCTYHGGDEPFEDVHPIVHEDGDVLVGACGLTAAAKLDPESPARYYAFSAWVHDYLSGEPMRATGILSPWASGRKAISLYDPVLTQATVHRAEKGMSTTMETSNVVVTVEVTDVSYGIARDVPANSYFTILAVKFGVKMKPRL